MNDTVNTLPPFNAATAVGLIWERAQVQLSKDELEWLADGVPDLVRFQAEYLATVTQGIGSLVGHDQHSGALSNRDEFPALLWSISHQVGVLGALAGIAGEAETFRTPEGWARLKSTSRKGAK